MVNAVQAENAQTAFAWKQFPARTTQHAVLVNAAVRAMNSTAKIREFIAHVHLNVVVNIVKSQCVPTMDMHCLAILRDTLSPATRWSVECAVSLNSAD